MASKPLHRDPNRGKRLPAQCHAPQCERRPHVRVDGLPLCSLHGQRFRKHGQFENPVKPKEVWRTCTQPNCNKPSRTRKGALCEMHYYRMYKTGSFDGPD